MSSCVKIKLPLWKHEPVEGTFKGKVVRKEFIAAATGRYLERMLRRQRQLMTSKQSIEYGFEAKVRDSCKMRKDLGGIYLERKSRTFLV